MPSGTPLEAVVMEEILDAVKHGDLAILRRLEAEQLNTHIHITDESGYTPYNRS